MSIRVVLLCLTLTLTALAGCQPQTAPPAPVATAVPAAPELVIRTYAVPDGQQNKLTSVLRRLIGTGEAAQGRVVQAPGNRVVVAAPAQLQESVGLLIKELAEPSKEARAPQSLAFDYWVVLGQSAEKTDASGVPAIADALVAVTQSDGPMAFRLVEQLSTVSLDSEEAEINGQWTRVSHTATATESTILANLEIEAPGRSKVRTVVQLAPDQRLVLGQMGFDPSLTRELGIEAPNPEASFKLYIIVRAALR